MRKRTSRQKGETRKLKETKEGEAIAIISSYENLNNLANTNQRQTTTGKHQAQRSFEKLKAPNMTQIQMLGEGNKKCAPTNIWERGGQFGE